MRALLQRAFCATALCSVVFFLTGCGTGKVDMSGKVTYNGKALKGGYVTFQAVEEGPTFSASIQEDGTYTMPGVREGEYKVCVETESLKGSKPAGAAVMSSKGARGHQAENPLAKVKENKVPEEAVKEAGYTPGGPPAAMAAANAAKYVQIPNEYAKAETTPLKVTVKSGQPSFDITLK